MVARIEPELHSHWDVCSKVSGWSGTGSIALAAESIPERQACLMKRCFDGAEAYGRIRRYAGALVQGWGRRAPDKGRQRSAMRGVDREGSEPI